MVMATIQTYLPVWNLESFDQAQDLEWRNFRADPFVLVNGQGYLYASKNGTTLTFAGTPYNGKGQVDLVYDSNAQDFAGWNLVGNPFNQTAYIIMPFYTLDGDSEYVEKADGAPINPMQGVLVHTDAAATLTFSTTPISNSKSSRLTLNLTQGRSITDSSYWPLAVPTGGESLSNHETARSQEPSAIKNQ